VPCRADVSELHALPVRERALLMEEIAVASRVLERLYRPHKLNVGALGNRVAQLHVHVIGRYRDDPAWPGPIWGSGSATPYEDARRTAELERLRATFAEEQGRA
jgi:diadenosine tetraphosphate (Ap4A) HIT family hydrolase